MNSSEKFDIQALLLYPSTVTGQILDKLLGTIFVLCTLIGTPGNILALGYFWSTKRKDLGVLLYIAICCIDICTSIVHFPVTIALFNERLPGLFSNMVACAAWQVIFVFLQLSSMFLVMLLSVSRTIAIALPFYKVNKK